MALRAYQELAVSMLRENIHRRPILCMATGSGKTAVASEVCRLAHQKGKRTLFLCDRIEIVEQTAARFSEFFPTGICAQGGSVPDSPHIVAAVQTLARRTPPQADLLIADECRLSMARQYRALVEQYPTRIGLDATPVRLDGKGLGALWGCILEPISVTALTDAGWLSRYRLFSTPFDPRGISKRGGDFDAEQSTDAMLTRKIVGDIIDSLNRHPGTFLLFACTVRHSLALVESLVAAGIAAQHLDGESADRAETLAALKNRHIRVISNVGLFGYGTDIPDLDGVVLARPTQSLALYRQQCGRALRPKPHPAIILDHAGNAHRHGAPDEPVEWSLDDGETRVRGPGVALCKLCYAVFPPSIDFCPGCGAEREKKNILVRQIDGTLIEWSEAERKRKASATTEQKRAMYKDLLAEVHLYNQKYGRAAHRYREAFDVWPTNMRDLVDAETRRCSRSPCEFCETVKRSRDPAQYLGHLRRPS